MEIHDQDRLAGFTVILHEVFMVFATPFAVNYCKPLDFRTCKHMKFRIELKLGVRKVKWYATSARCGCDEWRMR